MARYLARQLGECIDHNCVYPNLIACIIEPINENKINQFWNGQDVDT